VIAGASELAKRSSVLGAILVSLPLTSILAMVWLYRDGADTQKIIHFSQDIFWVVLPSLLFFLVFPLCLKRGMSFTKALLLSCGIMSGGYFLFAWLLKKWGLLSTPG